MRPLLNLFTVMSANGHDAALGSLLLALVILLPSARFAGLAAEKLRQPAVLGELVAGMALGNLGLIGIHGLEYLKSDAGLEILAGLGVILLLFEVGLESSLADLIKVGLSSLFVAVTGVFLPFALGWWVSAWLLPAHSFYVHSFIGATLCATSVGITARVLRDIGKIRSAEARIILGAAVIDDILGLMILAIVTGMITGTTTGSTLTVESVLWLASKVVIFLAGSLIIGIFLAPAIFRQAAKAQIKGMIFTLSLAACFLLSYLATLIELAAIVGAFAAGLILERIPFDELLHAEEGSLENLLHPVSTFLVPLFFMQMGIKIDLRNLFRAEVLGLALALTLAAVAGKQACGWGAVGRGLDRLSIGIGMIPRGEVGLIFAGVGLTLSIRGERIIDEALFAGIVVMVMITTLITPPLLQWSFARPRKKRPVRASEMREKP